MDSNRPGLGQRGGSRSEPLPVAAATSPNPTSPLSSSMSPSWCGSVGTAHMPQSQNVNMASAGNNTVVNIINPSLGDRENQTPNSQHGDLQDSTARADHEIYSSQLQTKKRGYPLWVPGPGMQLPIEYRRQGISIGDVGIITSTGEFDFLFNIFLPADHPINGGRVPQGFQPLPRQEFERDIQRTAVYGPNTHLESASVRKITMASETSTNHRFESTAKEAAILVMPHGATTQNLLNTWGIRLTISKKAKDWYTYARFTRGRDVKNGDIRVVVGMDKVSAWGIAISSCNIGQTASYVFKHDPDHAYKWDCTGGSGRVGPLKIETRGLIEDDAVLENQCVFVRTINFTLSGKIWNDSPSEANQQPVQGSGNLGRRHSASSNRRASGGRYPSSGSVNSSYPALSKQGSSQSFHVNFDDVEPGANHPSAELHNRLHENFPDADMVITEDMAVLSDDDMLSLESEDLCGRIMERHEPQNDWDIIHVFRKDDTNLRATRSMNFGQAGRMSALDGACTPPIKSGNQADDSPREDKSQDTDPEIFLNSSVSHEPELLHSDLLQESMEVHKTDVTRRGIEPCQGTSHSPKRPATGDVSNESGSSNDGIFGEVFCGPINVRGASLARDLITDDTSNEENSLHNSREANPGMEQQEGSDVVPISLNHDLSIEVGLDNSKRTTESATTKLPELPTIENLQLRLDIFTHKDLRPNPPVPREWGDNERLAELGTSVLNKVVTFHFFSKSLAHPEELKTLRVHYTSPNMLNSWLDLYQLKQRFCVPPNQRDVIYNDLDQMATYFHSYIGAVFTTKGLPAIQTWITGLIDRNENTRRTEQNIDFSGHASTSKSSPFSSSSSTISLSMVNEMAARRGVPIRYDPSQEGPDHQPIWTTQCYIGNAKRGVGVGKTRKIAKEEAARQAWVAMGW